LRPEEDPRRVLLLADLAASLTEGGDLERSAEVLRAAHASGAASPDGAGGARLEVEEQLLALFRSTGAATGKAKRVAASAVPIFERCGDHRGLARAWKVTAYADWTRGQVGAAAQAWRHAADHARVANDDHERADLLAWLASALWLGPSPVETAIPACEEIRAELQGHLVSEASMLLSLGGLHGLAGDFSRARAYFATSATIAAELGIGLSSASSHHVAAIEMLAGNYGYAERCLRVEYERLQAMGESSQRSTTAALLARAAFAQNHFAEAEEFARVGEELAQRDDLLTQILWRSVRAMLLATNGSLVDGERLSRESVELAAKTDLTNVHADALVDLASVMRAAGRAEEATALLAQALRLYEEKGNLAAIAQTQQLHALTRA
jgi:tetratricopeptide (TPR) repeat protein